MTPRQILYIEYFLETRIGLQAATKAGYADPKAGHDRCWKNRTIRAEIARRSDINAQIVGVNAQWVLKRAALLADFNLNKFIQWDPVKKMPFYDLTDATDDDWYCIQEMTTKPVVRGRGQSLTIAANEVTIKTYNKLKALELVGRHVGVKAFEETAEDETGDVAAALREIAQKLPN